jgi:hypothetical protein
MFGPTCEETIKALKKCIMRGFIIVTGVVIEQDKMAGGCDACGRRDKGIRNLGQKNEQKRLLGIPRC